MAPSSAAAMDPKTRTQNKRLFWAQAVCNSNLREGETEVVRANFSGLGAKSFEVEDARAQFLGALEGLTAPEAKRHAIGEEFVRVQQRILESEHYLDGQWVLGQGTIYPDTIESGGTAKADLIKTHHNRVPGIQKLMDAGLIVEPLADFYKDEVRTIGREQALRRGWQAAQLAPETLSADATPVAPQGEEHRGANEHNTCNQAIQAINEVDRVHHEDSDENG